MTYRLYTLEDEFIGEKDYVQSGFTGIVVYPVSVGMKEYLAKGKNHRLDGPAIIWSDGTKFWCIDDKNHRLDGPAVEYSDGEKEWWIDGKEITKEYHDLLHSIMKLKKLL